ncbi:MAG: aminoacyl-tRNA hydrolase [Desulfobulbus propionicus]|nr:MAG: aminoacyl-tRNA hydrolase [Desulfobulbus propionicus]
MVLRSEKEIVVTPSLVIPARELTFRFSCSGGPGGQNVNKVHTKVTLVFDLEHSPSLTALQKEGIRRKLAKRINQAGLLYIQADEHRTQQANRRAVIARFTAELGSALHTRAKRRRTAPPKSSQERRLQRKKDRSLLKRSRRRVVE